MLAELTKTRNALQSLLTVPAVCAAMTELLAYNSKAGDCTVARGIIGTRADSLLSSYDTRRALLLNLLATYHAKFG
jgi:hypothetical protein